MKLWLNVFCSPMRAKPIMCVPAGLNEAPTWKKKYSQLLWFDPMLKCFKLLSNLFIGLKSSDQEEKKAEGKKKCLKFKKMF